MFANALDAVVAVLERVLAAILVVLIILAVIGLCVQTWHHLGGHPYLTNEEVLHVLEQVLGIFVLVELFAIAMAYLRRGEVLRTLLEASLVAVTRKLIAFEPGADALPKGIALSALFLAVSVGWYLLLKVRAVQNTPPGR